MRPLVIGIAGGSASGKSTLAETLRTALQPRCTLLLAMDDYYKPYEELPLAVGRDGRQYRDYNHPDSFWIALRIFGFCAGCAVISRGACRLMKLRNGKRTCRRSGSCQPIVA